MNDLLSGIAESIPCGPDTTSWEWALKKFVKADDSEGEDTVRAYGQITEAGTNINWSSILSKLIKLAAKHCDHYASDLFYDWRSITEFLSSDSLKEVGKAAYLFGFRDMGVDCNSFVQCRLRNAGTYCTDGEPLYREIWRLTISTNASLGQVNMTLEKVRYIGGKD